MVMLLLLSPEDAEVVIDLMPTLSDGFYHKVRLALWFIPNDSSFTADICHLRQPVGLNS